MRMIITEDGSLIVIELRGKQLVVLMNEKASNVFKLVSASHSTFKMLQVGKRVYLVHCNQDEGIEIFEMKSRKSQLIQRRSRVF